MSKLRAYLTIRRIIAIDLVLFMWFLIQLIHGSERPTLLFFLGFSLASLIGHIHILIVYGDDE